MSLKRIFITGGAGFIGSRLCLELIPDHDIMIYDNFNRNSISTTNLMTYANFGVVHGDILDYNKLSSVLFEYDPDIVVHMAAVAGIQNVLNSPVRTMDINYIGTSNVLRALHENEQIPILERFVNFSTSEVFGQYSYKSEESHVTSLMPVGEARWTYSVSKLAAEHLVHSYNMQHALKTVNIRPFNIYGEGQVGEGAIHTLVTRALKNEPLLIQGEGDQIRSWCYISDMIDGIKLCIENPKAIGETFNLGNPRGTTTINMLAYLIKMISGSNSIIKNVTRDHVDVELRIPSIQKARDVLGFDPKIDLLEGLKRTIAWYGDNLNV
jgi:dTDP-glucose 4,6-dehydratase